MQSIIQDKKECWVCGNTKYLEKHHIFGGNPKRKSSELFGLTVWLCLNHHQGSQGVHNDPELMDMLHRTGQKAFEKDHTREEFINLFGRNYLE